MPACTRLATTGSSVLRLCCPAAQAVPAPPSGCASPRCHPRAFPPSHLPACPADDTAKSLVSVVPEDEPSAAPKTISVSQLGGNNCWAMGERRWGGMLLAPQGRQLSRERQLCRLWATAPPQRRAAAAAAPAPLADCHPSQPWPLHLPLPRPAQAMASLLSRARAGASLALRARARQRLQMPTWTRRPSLRRWWSCRWRCPPARLRCPQTSRGASWGVSAVLLLLLLAGAREAVVGLCCGIHALFCAQAEGEAAV